MLLRTWMGWIVVAMLSGGLSAMAKPPESPAKTTVNGKATPPLTQDFFQLDPLPAARGIREFRQPHTPNLAPPVANPAWSRLLLWFIMPV